MEKDQKFVEDVVKAIVENPSDVKTDRRVDEMGVLIELHVNPEDMGKIIGKEGKTAKAVRTLLRVLGAKSNARINLKIVEPDGSTRPERPVREEMKSEVSETKTNSEVDDEEEDKSADILEDVPTDVLDEE